MMKNRLFALVDLPDYSEMAILTADKFAKRIGAELNLMNRLTRIVPALADYETHIDVVDHERQHAIEHLQKIKSDLNVQVSATEVTEKPLPAGLMQLQSEQYFDWVFIALRTSGFLKNLVVGSAAIALINEANILVVAVSSSVTEAFPTKLVVAVSYKYALNDFEITQILHSLPSIRELEFVSVVTNETNKDLLQDNLDLVTGQYQKFNPVGSLIHGSDVATALKAHLNDNPDTYLVLQRGSRKLTDKLFRTFTINKLIQDCITPLIILSR